jgi:hypothetical protein
MAMPETLLRILLSELLTLRVRCRSPRCGALIEVERDHFTLVFVHGYVCPACNAPFAGPGPPTRNPGNPLRDLVGALQAIEADAGQFELEFSLKTPWAQGKA